MWDQSYHLQGDETSLQKNMTWVQQKVSSAKYVQNIQV